jgi:hypothetical protein
MNEYARKRIQAHPLMQSPHVVVSEGKYSLHANLKREYFSHSGLLYRTVVHLGSFIVSYIFCAGFVFLSVLVIGAPTPVVLVVLGLTTSGLFVSTFAWLRMLIVHRLSLTHLETEDDPGFSHHFAKSITYGFVALVFALLLSALFVGAVPGAGTLG